MRIIADLHIHSKWSRACSPDLVFENIAQAAAKKGLNWVATGDALHPGWLNEIKEKLAPADEAGLFKLRASPSPVRFVLSTEIACIYSRGGKTRRLHHVVLFPSLEAVERLIKSLEARKCNLKSDGRPIIGLDSQELLKLVLDASPECLLIPAHAWTPWFSIFGSKSGFDSIEECFGELAPHIHAIETGLSSDPAMNWRISALDDILLISNSDAHSCAKLAREANVFEMAAPSYPELRRILIEKDRSKFIETLEFFPEEGMYHADGHRNCDFWCLPEETRRLGGICPKCGKPLTVGVLYRVDELSDRPTGTRPPQAVPFRSIVPLAELVADAVECGKTSKKVALIMERLIAQERTELGILLEMAGPEIAALAGPEIASSILNMRNGQVDIRPGYDGEYGQVKIKGVKKDRQAELF